MNELIPIRELEGINGCDARELHQFLGVNDPFHQWIARRIETYGFVEGEDFCTQMCKSSGGRPRTDYHLSLDMAKELAMVENNAKGREVRRYFIECEKRLLEVQKQVAKATENMLHSLVHKLESLESQHRSLVQRLNEIEKQPLQLAMNPRQDQPTGNLLSLSGEIARHIGTGKLWAPLRRKVKKEVLDHLRQTGHPPVTIGGRDNSEWGIFESHLSILTQCVLRNMADALETLNRPLYAKFESAEKSTKKSQKQNG